MKAWVKVPIVTVVIAAPAMMLGLVIWPPAEGGPEPTGGQLPFFIFLVLMESVLFGLGISFLLFGLPAVRRVSADSKVRAWAMYLSIGWLMVSWWPRDNLHIHTGMNLPGLLYIEYGFHVTLVIVALVLAYCFLSLIRQWGMAPMSMGQASGRSDWPSTVTVGKAGRPPRAREAFEGSGL